MSQKNSACLPIWVKLSLAGKPLPHGRKDSVRRSYSSGIAEELRSDHGAHSTDKYLSLSVKSGLLYQCSLYPVLGLIRRTNSTYKPTAKVSFPLGLAKISPVCSPLEIISGHPTKGHEKLHEPPLLTGTLPQTPLQWSYRNGNKKFVIGYKMLPP